MDKNTGNVKTTRLFNLGSALFAFCLWGAWAYYINSNHGHSAGLTAGITQGTASFIITLVMVHAVRWLFSKLAKSPLRLFLPAVITVSLTASCLYTAHSLVGTLNIIATIAPALSVAFVFCVFTSYKLNRLSKNNNSSN